MLKLAIVIAAIAWAAPAAADLYRWVDPETGTVKFSSYPPPWYGDEAQQRRAPKVEHIPARSNQAAPLDPADDKARANLPEGGLQSLEAQRKAMLVQIAESAARGGTGQGVQKQLEAFAELSTQLDKVNPEGAAARRAEAEVLLQKLIKGERR